jgi:hypothetical protein
MWYFKPKQPGDTIREPVQGEFFATEAISDPGMALVREGIQNSLDAAMEGERVLVRIFVSGAGSAVAAVDVRPYVEDAWPHLRADGNGLLPDELPSTGQPMPYLVFEDFGTKGLEGDESAPFRSATGEKNHFYHFFRAEGQSDKESTQRGSWGVGKHVFPRSSRISSFFGFSVRHSDKARMLMGRLVLKSHYVGKDYCQDGYYGVRKEPSESLVMPITDGTALDTFSRVFRLERGPTEPGLSVVVPWPAPDITDQSIVLAVLRGYFYPILSGQLEVIVETPSVKTVLDKDSLPDAVTTIGREMSLEICPLIDLARWSMSLSTEQRCTLMSPAEDQAWQWSRALFPEDLTFLRQVLLRGEKLAFRVPVTVRKKGEVPQPSFFDVFMLRDGTETHGRPTFIREGVIIPKVDAPRTRGVRALVTVDDIPLASFLRDAENPAHTEWQHDGSNFRGKYKSGRSDLAFVKRSVHEIIGILTETGEEEDPSLLVDFFFLPEGAVAVREEEADEKEGREPPRPPPPPPPPQPQRFRIQKVAGGFSIVPGSAEVPAPCLIEMRVAYDVTRGNPLKRYSPEDFDVQEAPIILEPPPEGVEIVERAENLIVIRVLRRAFSFHLKGFDENRDLYVRAVLKEATDGGQTA